MSKSSLNLNVVTRNVVLILLAVLMFTGLAILILIIFVPVAGWYIWRANDRIKALEAKLADKEKQPGQP